MKKDIKWFEDELSNLWSARGMVSLNDVHKLLNEVKEEREKEKREQRYYVIFPSMDENGKGFNYLAKDTYHNELWIEDSRTDGLDCEERSSFTEDEIRNLEKGDILFKHFAIKSEEAYEHE